MVWIVVGGRAVIENSVRVLGFCKVRRIDADGNEVQ